MKIISVISPIKFGGGERLLLDKAKILKEKGIDYIILCLNRSKEFEEHLKREKLIFFNLTNIELKQTPTKKDYLFLFLRLLSKIFKLRKIIIKETPDILISNGFPAVFLVPLSLFNLPQPLPKLIYIHHSVKSKEFLFLRKIYLWFLKKYKRIIGVSSQVEKTLKEVFPEIEDKILNIPNGIDLKRFNLPETKEKLREKLNLPNGILGLNIARLSPFKNQRFLIRVAKEIKRDDFYILIIGEGDEYEKLKKEIERENLKERVRVLGFVPNDLIPYYMKAADAFLYPSLKEGLSIVLLEAMVSGLPVIIFKDIYVDELGKEVLVANDEDEFINYVKVILENENFRKEKSKKIKNYALNFDIKRTVKKYLEIFYSL